MHEEAKIVESVGGCVDGWMRCVARLTGSGGGRYLLTFA